jgi:hypothetical protein
LGEVRCIVAPNRFHYLSVGEYSRAFPDAEVFVAPGVKVDDVPIRGILTGQAESLWSDVLDQAIFYGNKMEQEVVFFHRDSRTLIVTDLCFNLRRAKAPLQRLVARLLDIDGKFGQSRLSRVTTSTGKQRALPATDYCVGTSTVSLWRTAMLSKVVAKRPCRGRCAGCKHIS